MIVGWMVKDFGQEFASIKMRKNDKMAEAQTYLTDSLKKMKDAIIQENDDPKTYWKIYSEIEAKLGVVHQSNYERTIYDEQAEFAKLFALKMLDIFYSNKDILLMQYNNLIPAITSEISRSINEHGGKESLTLFCFQGFR